MPPRDREGTRATPSRSGKPGNPLQTHPRALRRFSQNFLINPDLAAKIVHLCQVGREDTVIEIGPGTGALTGHLIAAAEHVHAVELDRKLFDRLRVEYASEPSLSLHQRDILTVRIQDLVPDRRVVVVGNLPYAITSDLVLWLLRQHTSIRRAVVLMQREVAERLTAEPGERAGGSLTLAVRYRAEAERILDVPPTSFRPVPKVWSSLVAFRFQKAPAVSPRDEDFFFKVIRAGFGKRRKTLINSLTAGLEVPRKTLEEVVDELGMDPRIRGERLTLEDFCRVADLLGERLRVSGEGPQTTSPEEPRG